MDTLSIQKIKTAAQILTDAQIKAVGPISDAMFQGDPRAEVEYKLLCFVSGVALSQQDEALLYALDLVTRRRLSSKGKQYFYWTFLSHLQK